MNKITLYLAKTLLGMIMLTLLLFVGIEQIFSWVNELRVIGKGDYTLGRATVTILLSLPNTMAALFPMAALVGTLLGLGLLASRSELIVMQSAGMSIRAIIKAVLKLAAVLIVLSWFMGECVAPVLDRWAHRQKAVALSGGQALHTAHGTWMREGDNFIHVQSMPSSEHLEGITSYQFDKNMDLRKSSFAKQARYENKRWTLYDIKETHFEDKQTTTTHFSQQPWLSHIEPEILKVVKIKDIDELSLMGLWQTIRYRSQNQLDAKPYQLAFWQKMARPFATVVMMFLAIPFIFGPLRSSTMGLRMLVGIFVGFAFYTVSQLFGPLTLVYSFPPFLGAFIPLVLFGGTGLFLLKRAGH